MEGFLFIACIIMVLVSPILFIIGLVITLSQKENKKTGIIFMISSVVLALIGFGGCIGMLDGMH